MKLCLHKAFLPQPKPLDNNVLGYKGTPQIPVFDELGGKPMFPA